MARGFKTGGRKPGSRNKRTLNVEALTAKVEQSLAEPFEGDAHALLMLIYKDKTRDIELRIDAAKAAIRFEKPALGHIESKNEHTVRYVARVPSKAKTTQEWQQQHERPTAH